MTSSYNDFGLTGPKGHNKPDEFNPGDEYDGKLNFIDIVILAACLCSSDTVAPMSFLDASTNAKLYSIVFGEGVLNDVVSILLVSAASSVPSTHLNYGLLLWNLVYFLVTSTLLGLCGGLLISVISKRLAATFRLSKNSDA